MPITVCISELRNSFHSMLMFFMFHLIIYFAVNVQVLAGTEVTTLVFIVELKYCNTSEFVSEII